MVTITEEQNLDTIGKRINACMKQYGISMRAVSRKLGISQPSVFKWTHDELKPKIEQIEGMAALFHVTPEWLAFGRAKPQEKASEGTNEGVEGNLRGMSLGISNEVAKTLYGVNSNDLFFHQLISDEMSPSFNDGDIAIVNRTVTTVKTSGVYVLCVGHDYVVRRIQRLVDGTFCITCDNKNYPEAEIMDYESDLEVIGKVVSKVTFSSLV